MAERADVTAAALVDVDVELARLHAEAVASDDEFAVALHWAQIDMMLDRRLTISARRTNAAEGAPTGSPADGSES